MSYAGPEFDAPSPRRRALRRPLIVGAAALAGGALAGWAVSQAVGGSGASGPASAAPPSANAPAAPAPGLSASPGPTGDSSGSPDASAPSGTSASPNAADKPLAGRVVVIDPGHNPNNHRHPAEINKKVDIGTGWKECDTTGTVTNSGYAEAAFTLDVAHRLRDLLTEQGATVTLTHDGDREFGPCIDERARIGNRAKADAVVSIHADGAGEGRRGFHVILPGPVTAGAADTSAIVEPSAELGERIAGALARATGSAPSNYIGSGTGLVTRRDLGGLNLSTVPKVFVECGNMRDTKDAALLTSGAWRQKAAQGMSEGITGFLRGRPSAD